MDDAQLMTQVQSGDETALAAVMAEWELPVKGLLMRILHNERDAIDLAQETFVRVWEQRAKYRPGAAFRPWLFAIAVNLARNRLRWWKRRPEVTLDAWSGEGDSTTGAHAAELKERATAVRQAIETLPRDWKAVILLAEFEGMTHGEIATVTGTTAKAVESRLYRARAALRQSLAKWL